MINRLITLKNITLYRDGAPVLKGVNWAVVQGEHWFILGNNGSGKTSLLDILMGYVWPQQGEVYVFGERYGGIFLPDLRKRIGYVSPWIFKRTPENELAERVVASGCQASAGYLGPIPERTMQLVDERLAITHGVDLKGRQFGKLSTGQQLKVMLGRALINDPELLILDEPFSGLDIGNRKFFYGVMDSLIARGNVSVLLVTHHLEDIREGFSHGLILKDGRVFARGVKNEVLKESLLEEAFQERSI